MNNFYIEKLIVSGGKHKNTELDFIPGVNFILGPSNTGKSLVLDCIDYAFGSKSTRNSPLKIENNSEGYTQIQLNLRTDKSKRIHIIRNIGDSKVEVYSEDPRVESGTYNITNTSKNKKNINDIFLPLMGIDETPQILKNLDGKKINLTWRSILYLFLMKQTDVDRETSALLSPIKTAITSSKSILLYLLTGEDATNVLTIEPAELRNAKQEYLNQFVRKQIDRSEKELINIQKSLEPFQNINLDNEMKFIQHQILVTQQKIDNDLKREKEILSKINSLNIKSMESKTLKESFLTLYEQYQSDIQRIKFIITGVDLLSEHHPKLKTCPICNQEIHEELDIDYILACSTELEKLEENSSELLKVIRDLEQKQQKIVKKIQSYEAEKVAIQHSQNSVLAPTLNTLDYKLKELSAVSKLQAKSDIIRENIEYYSTLQKIEYSKKDKNTESYTFKEKFDIPIFKRFECELKNALANCHLRGAEKSNFNMDVFDLEISNKVKSVSMGGGYNSVLNTIIALTMSNFLVENNCKAPGFFIVDSVLTQLSEAEHLKNSETIKENFVKYLLNNSFNEQIIIVEQKKRMPFIPTDKGIDVKVTEFTGEKFNGRYGLLNDVYNAD